MLIICFCLFVYPNYSNKFIFCVLKYYAYAHKILRGPLNVLHNRMYSPEKLCHNRICCPSNRSKQVPETHTAYISGTQYKRQSLNEKQHTWLHRQRQEWHVAEKVNQSAMVEVYYARRSRRINTLYHRPTVSVIAP